MNEKKKSIIHVLAATAQDRRSLRGFRYGAVEIKIDPDSPVKGVEFDEHIQVSIYDHKTDRYVVFSVKIENVTVIENALSDSPPDTTAWQSAPKKLFPPTIKNKRKNICRSCCVGFQTTPRQTISFIHLTHTFTAITLRRLSQNLCGALS